ncbi:hypothetical protein SA2149_00200 [Aggregatibacter actinomycetemcomitans serotype e str. SA2149]|nr:hypothetical protein SA2149_00200 [Aggregatibacter actinomycetemcomitans serotype e str. SA2149]KYK82221.1 hypothetical protein SC383S_00285 [Aggregatibacter actinomycetemcomitans SC383s]
MLEIDFLHYPFILTSKPSNYKLGDVMSNFKIWAILSGLDLVLMMMLDSRLTSIFVASILLWSLIFSVREYISKNYSNIFHWIIVIPATIYLFYSGVNIWLIVLYVIFGLLSGINVPDMEKDRNSIDDIVIAITFLFIWLTRDAPFTYKLIAPVIFVVFYAMVMSEKEKKERDAARQHINIDGNDYMIPQCNKCNSYDTILVELEELSTSYGNTEGYVEERFLKNVVKVRRTRYTDYNLTYKCKNCGEVGVKNLQTRTREHI